MMSVIVTGTDEYDIAAAIDDAGHDVTTVDIGNLEALEEAGIDTADVYVLTEHQQATSIPLAKERNPEVSALVYADGSLPDFARGQADLVLDPALFDPDDVAAELDS
jgi:Trk K+ transport system NAD-binding subunit